LSAAFTTTLNPVRNRHRVERALRSSHLIPLVLFGPSIEADADAQPNPGFPGRRGAPLCIRNQETMKTAIDSHTNVSVNNF
jgi:hypothetical protein